MANEVVTLSGILIFSKYDLNTVSKGESEFKAGLELKIVGYLIEAQVRASMKDRTYRTPLTVDGNGGIREAECECPMGSMVFERPIYQMHG